ncbi:MAG TPA: sodium:proton exchanger [Bacteroidetes bacterium]|nr:sodium:proton exchanger [Bacteroidota bacterium]
MGSIFFLVSGFTACTLLIVWSGSRLSRYGDIIAELTGMGKAWFGLIMMAAVTSLPELVTGISSVVIVDSPDIAVGDVMGSCAFNLLILAILDYFVPGKPLLSSVTKGHILAGLFGIVLLSLAVVSIIYGSQVPVIGWFSSSSILLIILYLVALRTIFQNEKQSSVMEPVKTEHNDHEYIPLDKAVKKYILFSLVVVSAALALPFFADQIAEQSGISKTFVGTLLVAATTSLPELVVSIAAVRMGSMDIAVGNLLGSNIFNMLILALDDLMYTRGPLLPNSNPDHALGGLAAILMTAIVGIGILYSKPNKRFVLGIDAIVLIAVYISMIISLYRMG